MEDEGLSSCQGDNGCQTRKRIAILSPVWDMALGKMIPGVWIIFWMMIITLLDGYIPLRGRLRGKKSDTRMRIQRVFMAND